MFMEEDKQGNSMDTFNGGTTYTITVIPRTGDNPSAGTCFIKIQSGSLVKCKYLGFLQIIYVFFLGYAT
jgi:hypothetical protein